MTLHHLRRRSESLIQFARREIKLIRAGKLSTGAIERLRGNSLRERFIKPLGKGGMSQVDLVLHPRHGIVVRKSPLPDISNYPKLAQGARDIHAAQQELGPSGFAKIHEVEPGGITYQEYVPGETHLAKTKGRTLARLQSIEEAAQKRRVELVKNPEVYSGNGLWAANSKRQDRARFAQKKIFTHEIIPTTKQRALINRVHTATGNNVWDLRGSNVINGKIVDAEVGYKGAVEHRTGRNYSHEMFRNRKAGTLSQLHAISESLIQFGAKRKIVKPTAEDVSHALLKSPKTGTQDKANIIANILGGKKRKPQHGIEGSEDMGAGSL